MSWAFLMKNETLTESPIIKALFLTCNSPDVKY